ncbi:MAG: riboflavin synthase subunit alpha [Bdellovibrionota bacterium]|nr:MAG: riboflavin synthase subunit alpha [Bdellovibrionota bacterium]
MFTGIVQGRGIVREISARPGLLTFRIALPTPASQNLQTGASICVDGVCLTATRIEDNIVDFDVMQQTLTVTTLGGLSPGAEVNIERSMQRGGEIGGHVLSGHIDTSAQIVRLEQPENNYVIHFQVKPEWMRYIFAKGYVALHGASLTVASIDRDSSTFCVWLIPETLRLTTFGLKKIGDRVNLEVDRTTQVIVDTVRSFLTEHLKEMLKES